MAKTFKITIELDDKILTLEGSDAEKWFQHCSAILQLALSHGMSPFETDSVKWTTKAKTLVL